jgi:type I restriction-modification system DNA methylase subunit
MLRKLVRLGERVAGVQKSGDLRRFPVTVSRSYSMFYTVTLSATLWFFDKGKTDDKILFIDARNVFTQIDRAHREFSPEQVSNLAVISHLRLGKRDRLMQLVDRYFRQGMEKLAEKAKRENSKRTQIDRQVKALKATLEEVRSAEAFFVHVGWLQERFPEARYEDVTGLCKLATPEEVREQDYSLNPGRYVGVVIEEDGKTEEEFLAEILGLNAELERLNGEAHLLEGIIGHNGRQLVGDE